MYCKLLANKREESSTGEQLIKEIIADRLPKTQVISIIEAYYRRIFSEADFNIADFFLDLKGYLKYLPLEEKNKQKPIAKITRIFSDPLRISAREQILKKHGYYPTKPCKEDGHEKMSCLVVNKNEVVRFYYDSPASHLYDKLMGTSESDVSKFLANPFLAVDCKNIAGEPMDVQERALPLFQVFRYLRMTDQDKLIATIKMVQATNPLITDFVEGDDDNIGLVVRQEKLGPKRVYVVAFDLDLMVRYITRETNLQIMSRMREQCSTVRPNFLDYEQMVDCLPALKSLSVRQVDSGRNFF